MDRKAIYNFFRAVLAGTLAGGGPFLVLSIPIAVSHIIDGNVLSGLTAAIFPVGIAGGLVLAAALLIGLPLTAVLRSTGRECPKTYATVGGLTGMLIPIFVIPFIGLLLAIPGVIAGATTGHVWGNYRKSLSATRYADENNRNPIHDLIY